MDRIVAMAAVLGLLLVPLASAGHGTETRSEEIYASNIAYPDCHPFSVNEELYDATWKVNGYRGHVFTLESESSWAFLDADVYFYDGDCDLINYLAGTKEGSETTERGIVPSRASWAHVRGEEGLGTATLTLGAGPSSFLPWSQKRTYVGNTGVALDASDAPMADEYVGPDYGVGGARFKLYGPETSVRVVFGDVNTASDLPAYYAFKDSRRDVTKSGCVDTPVDLAVPADATTLAVFPPFFTDEDPCGLYPETTGEIQVTFT